MRAKTEEEVRRRRAEAEARLIEAEAKLQAEHEAALRAEQEAQRLAEEARQRAEAHARAEEEALRVAQEAETTVPSSSNSQPLQFVSNDSELNSEFAIETNQASSPQYLEADIAWPESHADAAEMNVAAADDVAAGSQTAPHYAPVSPKGIDVVFAEKGIVAAEEDGGIPSEILTRLSSHDPTERQSALAEVVRVGGDDAFRCITRAFDDESVEVRNAAACALFDLQPDRAATFTRALREGTTERRRKIGQALAGSGLAKVAIANLTGESREKTYDAFSLLFLMAKAGEVQPLMQAIEDYPNVEIRIAVVKLLALSGQPEIVPAFRRMAVRGSLPAEVRSAVMEAIYQIGSHARESAPSAA